MLSMGNVSLANHKKETEVNTYGHTRKQDNANVSVHVDKNTPPHSDKKTYSCLAGACCMNQTECRTEKAQLNHGTQELMQY